MAKTDLEILSGELLDEGTEITLVQLCRSCAVRAETIEAMVEQGILEPSGTRGHHWCFPATSINLESAVGRGAGCVIFFVWQGTTTSNSWLLRGVVTQPGGK